jgi:chemotaxis protein MotB
MRRRRRIERRPSHDRWLVSYADFITLLFAFFVVMYSAAQLDKPRAGKLSVAIQTAFEQHGSVSRADTPAIAITREPRPTSTNAGGEDLSPLQLQVEAALAPEIAVGDAAVRSTPEGLVISLREVGFFESGSADIRASSKAAFERLAKVLTKGASEIRIEGHTDNVPIHNGKFESNWDLSTARATATIRLLAIDYGIDPQRLSAAGYGEYRPIASNSNSEGRGLNRRVDVVVRRAELRP